MGNSLDKYSRSCFLLLNYKCIIAHSQTFSQYCITVHGIFKRFNYQAGSFISVVAFDLVIIPQWLEVIPQWFVVIPQQQKFKAPESIIKKGVSAQVNICEQQLGTMDCYVAWHQKLRHKQVTYHSTLVGYRCYLYSTSIV